MLGQISFSFSHKYKTKNVVNKNYKDYEVIEKDVIGVVFIDINANYSVKVNNFKFDIKPECFEIKKQKNLYHKLYNGRLLYIRYDTNKKLSSAYWCPFAPGCSVIGNIVRNKLNKTYFQIKTIWNDNTNNDAIDAFKFYIDNIEEINKNMKIKIMEEINGIK